MPAAIQVNEQVRVSITGCTHQGEGVGRVDGLAVFVPQTAPGDEVDCVVTEVKKNFARARLVEVIHPAPGRTDPACSIYQGCGGCHFQYLDYQQQLVIKTGLIRDTLHRLGKLTDYELHPMIGTVQPWHYRNKVYLHAGMQGGLLALGFYEGRSHQLEPITDCALLPAEFCAIARALTGKLRATGILPFESDKNAGLLRGVIIRKGFTTGEVMVVFVTTRREFPGMLAWELMREFPSVVSVVQNINPPQSTGPLGTKTVLLAGKQYIRETVGPFMFRVAATSFFQVNPVQAEVLYQHTVAYAGLTGSETALDVYCGTGTISLFLAQKASRVYGIETNARAVADARENARLNGVDNVEFLDGASETELPRLFQDGIHPAVVVLDPPRQGCDLAVLTAVAGAHPERIVYVSCDPATLARDLRVLAELGYRTIEVQPVDMFPQTAHVECVIGMQRKDT